MHVTGHSVPLDLYIEDTRLTTLVNKAEFQTVTVQASTKNWLRLALNRQRTTYFLVTLR